MTENLPTTTTPPQEPICVACADDRTNPDGGPCLRCRDHPGTDPDPLAPTSIVPVAS
jgi:hypothetical protein